MSNVVLVTGGLGQIGSHVSRALIAAGRTPLIYDLRTEAELIPDIVAQCMIVRGGLDNFPCLIDAIAESKPAAVLHFAAKVGQEVERQPWNAIASNFVGTAAVFEAARLCGVRRVIFGSSKMVYGGVEKSHQHPLFQPVTEDHPREPQDAYGKLKRATEDIASHYASLYQMDLTALRFASSFGPAGPSRHKVLLSQVIESAVRGQPLHIETGGEQADTYCYSAEAANAAIAALDAPTALGRFRAYNIAGDELLTLADIVSILKELYPQWDGRVGGGLDYKRTGLGAYYRMDTSRARAELGWQPRFDFREAVRDYARVMDLIGRSP